jgi:hypothetical protein
MLKPKSLLTLFGAAALGALALAAPPASANLISCASGTLNCNLGSTENFTANFNATTTGSTTA